MDNGVIVEQGPPEQVIDRPSQERTRLFLSRLSEVGEAIG
jgi:ABC-type histidine transport system ATPase subunit